MLDSLSAARAAFEQGDLNQARDLLQGILKSSPSNAEAWNDLGVVHHVTGDPEASFAAFQNSVVANPEGIDARINLARQLHTLQRLDDGAVHARWLLDHAPEVGGVPELIEDYGLFKSQRPLAVILDWNRALRRRTRWLRVSLNNHGFQTRTLPLDVVKAAAATWCLNGREALARLIQRLDPCLVVVEANLDLDGLKEAGTNTALERCSARGAQGIVIGPANGSHPTQPTGYLEPDADDQALATHLAAVVNQAEIWTPEPDCGAPLISVIAPTYDRPVQLQNLLDLLAVQDLPPELFEVLIVDDGSADSAAERLVDSHPPYALLVRWQPNQGPAAARNRALQEARGDYLVILNDDAVPRADVLRRHLVAQGSATAPEAVLGTFDFGPEACEDPFTDLMQHSNLLFEYGRMIPGALHGWTYFWTCNISVPTALIRAVGGFDEAFRDAICEDVELGRRLEAEGVKVRFDPRIQARHDHDLSLDRYLKRAYKLGIWQHRILQLHPDASPQLLGIADGWNSEALWLRLRRETELSQERDTALRAECEALIAEARTFPVGSSRRTEIRKGLNRLVRTCARTPWRRGLVDADISARTDTAPPLPSDSLASIIIPNLNGMPHVRDAIESLRSHTEGRFEVIIIDNGSDDGSREWLESQPDVQVLPMGCNIGAPAARNVGLEVAQGDVIVFSDNDVIFTPGWRSLLEGHLRAWPDIGVVGPMSDYVSGSQKTEERERSDESLPDFAQRFSSEHQGDHAYSRRLILFFMMVRRDVITKIGGIDPIFGRWGYEDDDFCLRARLAGYQLRVAKDCFIRHLGSRTARTANIDYNQLLVDNFDVFKKKWGFPAHLKREDPISLEGFFDQAFDPEKHYVPLGAAAPVA